MRIAVLDDDRQEMNDFITALHGWDSSRNAECFESGAALLEAARKERLFSIAFLDIYLPNENGVEIAERLLQISPDTEIVFTTTSREFAVEAYQLDAVHYIVKPVKTQDIIETFARVTQKWSKRKSVSLKIGKELKLIYTDEIAFAQSNKHKTTVRMKSGMEFDADIAFSALTSSLGDDFLLLSRGIIANGEYIDSMASDSCVLKNGQTVLFSRKEKAAIKAAYNDYVYRRLAGRENTFWEGGL